MRHWSLHTFPKVTSTMDVMRELLTQKSRGIDSEGYVVLAEEQTAGRGRYQRSWVSPIGNFYCSIAIMPRLLDQDLPLYSFAAIIALHKTILEFIQPSQLLSIKWPNDLLLNGKKLAGILLELVETPHRHLVIGLGVNLLTTPSHTSYPATDLYSELKIRLSPAYLLNALLAHLTDTLEVLEKQGFASIRLAWLAARYPQDALTIKTYRQDVAVDLQGTFVDLDGHGRLVFKENTTQQLQTIAAGDIYFP